MAKQSFYSRRLVRAAESASNALLSLVGALFLMADIGASVRGEPVVITAAQPMFPIFLGSWIVVVLVLTLWPEKAGKTGTS